MGSARKTLLNPVGSYSKLFLCYAVLFSNRTLYIHSYDQSQVDHKLPLNSNNFPWRCNYSKFSSVPQKCTLCEFFMRCLTCIPTYWPICINKHQDVLIHFFFINISNGSHTFRNFYNTEVKKILKKWDNGLYCRKPETCFRIISYLLFFNKGRTHLFRLRQKNTKTRFVVDVMD